MLLNLRFTGFKHLILLYLVSLGGVDAEIMFADGFAFGTLGDGIWAAGERCVDKPVKETFISKHWFTLLMVTWFYDGFIGEYFQTYSF